MCVGRMEAQLGSSSAVLLNLIVQGGCCCLTVLVPGVSWLSAWVVDAGDGADSPTRLVESESRVAVAQHDAVVVAFRRVPTPHAAVGRLSAEQFEEQPFKLLTKYYVDNKIHGRIYCH